MAQVCCDVFVDLVWRTVWCLVDCFTHVYRYSVSAGCAVAERAGRNGVRTINSPGEIRELACAQFREPLSERSRDLLEVTALALPDQVLNGQLPPVIEIELA